VVDLQVVQTVEYLFEQYRLLQRAQLCAETEMPIRPVLPSQYRRLPSAISQTLVTVLLFPTMVIPIASPVANVT
jgi:hypothetical protein